MNTTLARLGHVNISTMRVFTVPDTHRGQSNVQGGVLHRPAHGNGLLTNRSSGSSVARQRVRHHKVDCQISSSRPRSGARQGRQDPLCAAASNRRLRDRRLPQGGRPCRRQGAPLFRRVSNNTCSVRTITPDGAYRVLAKYADLVDIDINGFGPHALRATAITNAFDTTPTWRRSRYGSGTQTSRPRACTTAARRVQKTAQNSRFSY